VHIFLKGLQWQNSLLYLRILESMCVKKYRFSLPRI
jgi:hypothetical protein